MNLHKAMYIYNRPHASPRSVADAEGVWSQDFDLERLASIQFSHALHLGEGHVVAILHTVAGIVQACDNTFAVARDAGDHRAHRWLAVRVHHCEGITEIAKYLREEATGVGNYESYIIGTSNLRDA